VSVPVLAVVGHPNKGKSSIVATLAHDASVAIAPEPGTTTRTRRYPMKVGGETLYVLADTPGFQRARRALAWMRAHGTDAAHRAEVVRAFVETHRSSDAFVDECELLGPIVQGAGILYVVDGAKPYGTEYEPEMEILRWSGRPRLALVNTIGAADHVEAWRAALGQYFSVVRVFDAMTADFTRQVELLRAFGQLEDGWAARFDAAARALEADRRERHRLAARAIAEMVADALALILDERLAEGADVEAARRAIEQRYQGRLRVLEESGRRAVERVYDHTGLERSEPALRLLAEDLFSEQTWQVWGLTPRQLAVTGALGGALAGGGIDLALGGASLLAGSLVGAATGAAAAWLGGGQIAEVRVGGLLPLGGRRLTAGPCRSVNLPYVLLGRALHHQRLVALRTHAHRDRLEIPEPAAGSGWLDALGRAERADLARCLSRLRRDQEPGTAADALAARLEPLVCEVDGAP
jgi:hypothetical protein